MDEEKYLVAIIDNDRECLRDLQANLHDEFKTIAIELIDNIDELVDSIILSIEEKDISAIVIDFKLSDDSKDRYYNGSDIIKRLHERFINFPAVIVTSHSENEAEDTSENPYLVFEREKDVLFSETDDFKRKLKKYIENYNSTLDNLENEYIDLVNKDKLSLEEDEQLLRLEQSLIRSPRGYQYPSILKSHQSFHILDDLEEATTELLAKIKSNK